MSKIELKPCPFCGSSVELEQTESFYSTEFGVRKWWGVVCRSTTNRGGTCAIQTRPAASEEAAVARWNMRSTLSDAAQDLLEALEDLYALISTARCDIPDAKYATVTNAAAVIARARGEA